MATTTYQRQINGTLTEVRTVEVSAGAADAGKIPNTNAAGVLDLTVLGAVQASAGAGDAAKPVALASDGRLSPTMMPVGVSIEALSVTASETIAAGDFVNFHNSSGLKVRKADSTNGRRAHGYAPAGIANGAAGDIYIEGTNGGATGCTPGATQFLAATGGATETAPSTAGHILQVLGVATSATAISFEPSEPITLA